AAAGDRLPRLIRREDIAGDMHYHSDRSGDGRSSLEEMVEAAIEAGYRYVAFTDHGEDLTINGSSREEMLAHRDRIRQLDDRYPEIDLLFGCELNIGPDGSLDYDPKFRLEFDWCVASIHSHFDLPAEQQTIRVLKALSDPAVNAIGHLTGRYVGRRPGVELDVDAVLEGLATTGVALEINGALDRLDATDEVARRAMAAGVDVVIDTDSHHTRELIRMDYGVRWAQRGWVTVDRVLNARPIEEIRARVAARRRDPEVLVALLLGAGGADLRLHRLLLLGRGEGGGDAQGVEPQLAGPAHGVEEVLGLLFGDLLVLGLHHLGEVAAGVLGHLPDQLPIG